MKNVYPTHTCFDDAFDFLGELARDYPAALIFEGYKLIHAICLMPDDREYSHAWVESAAGEAHFFGMLNGKKVRLTAEAKEYRRNLRVKEFTEYTTQDACKENLRHGNYGPWIPKYRRLCKDQEGV